MESKVIISNYQFSMNNQLKNYQFDLEERTAKLAEAIIDLVKPIKITAFNKRVIDQLVGSGGSMGANYCEANESESKKDFIHKIGICKKETKEAKHWLRFLARANPEKKEQIKELWQETQELFLIFSNISRSSRNKH